MPENSAASRTLEIERKYDAEAATPLPQWQEVAGVLRVSAGEVRPLDALYLDTATLTLARAEVAVRRRTGGPDAGWHIKGPRQGDARLELGWPLGDGEEIPDAVAEALASWTTDPLSPLARIQNHRTAFHLFGAHGVIAEFVDDQVIATDLRRGVQTHWREWEFELGPAAPADDAARAALFAAAEVVIFAAGATPPSSGSKLARALGR